MKTRKQPWSELEKYQLWLAYRLKTPLQVMSQWFHRGPSSVNHALIRYNIRPVGFRSAGPYAKTNAKRPLSPQELERIYKVHGLIQDKTDSSHTRYWSPIGPLPSTAPSSDQTVQPNKITAKTAFLKQTPPWQTQPHPSSSPPLDEAQRLQQIFSARADSCLATETFPEETPAQQKRRQQLAQSVFLWVSFYDVVAYLEDQGVHVRPYQGVTPPSHLNWEYQIDRKPLTKAHVLMAANKLRITNKQEPFLVKSISQN